MKKLIALLVSLSLVLGMAVIGAVSAFAEGADEAEYVRFTADGNDPYGTFTFSDKGTNTTIDPDTVTWAAVRYRTISQKDTQDNDYIAQFYISPAQEPCIPVTWTFSGNWETVVVDLTSVKTTSDLESKFDSTYYTAVSSIRFDPLESNRDAETNDPESGDPEVVKGDSIDVAWIAFFKTEEEAKAYTGTGDSPYCILDADSLTKMTGKNNITATKYVNGEAAATPEPPEGPDTSKGFYDLYDKEQGTSTGWWLHPVAEGATIDVEFETPVWFNGVEFFAFCSENNVHLILELYDDNDDLVYEGQFTTSSNASVQVSLDKAYPSGYYRMSFVGEDHDEDIGDTWFVLGSGMLPEGLEEGDITVAGGLTNDSTKDAPMISLIITDEDPDYEKPTEVVTPTKEPPAETPTSEPEPTEEPTAEPVATPEPQKKPGCGTVIGGGIAVIGLLACGAFLAKRKH
ncbi:MAG: hypothetical protein ILO53_05780 [Clostridia bacterium]|nr:hypothetical protein [Clostridia bacterium]